MTSQIIAFRLNAHHLGKRLPPNGLLDAAGACGIQDSPPGSALLALHARVEGMTAERMDLMVAQEKSLLRSWSMRGAPFLFPTSDGGVFTAGVLPQSETERRHFVLGVGQALDRLDLGLDAAVDLVRAHIRDVLAGHMMAVDELGVRLAERIAAGLPQAWAEIGPYAPGQPLGEAVVHFCLRILTLEGIICFAPRDENKAPFVLVDEWLGHPLPPADRAELVRRYLRCYGPSSTVDFAGWAGVRDGGPWWRLVAGELTEVSPHSWILTEDLAAFNSPPTPQGVRLLPPSDPYIQLRDRETVVPEQKLHREIWKTVGAPGTVLHNGRLVAAWRQRKNGRRLAVTVGRFTSLTTKQRTEIADEAQRVARLRGSRSAEVDFGD
jgi:winged helix DNA-binding protein